MVLLEGRAQVVEQAALNSGQYHGVVVLISHAEPMERLGALGTHVLPRTIAEAARPPVASGTAMACLA